MWLIADGGSVYVNVDHVTKFEIKVFIRDLTRAQNHKIMSLEQANLELKDDQLCSVEVYAHTNRSENKVFFSTGGFAMAKAGCFEAVKGWLSDSKLMN